MTGIIAITRISYPEQKTAVKYDQRNTHQDNYNNNAFNKKGNR